MLPVPQFNACTSLHTTFLKSFNSSFVKQLISEILRTKELLKPESFLKCINNYSFALFIIVQIVTGAWFEDHRLLHEMCLFSSTPVSVLCAHLRAEFGHVWLVDYNKHMGKWLRMLKYWNHMLLHGKLCLIKKQNKNWESS